MGGHAARGAGADLHATPHVEELGGQRFHAQADPRGVARAGAQAGTETATWVMPDSLILKRAPASWSRRSSAAVATSREGHHLAISAQDRLGPGGNATANPETGAHAATSLIH